MVFKIGQHGDEALVALSSLRKGDIFYTVDGDGEGPLLEALSDAEQRPSPRDPSRMVWACATQFAGEFRAVEHPEA